MRSFIPESGVEEVCLDYFADLGWEVLYGPDIAPDEARAERASYRDVLLEDRLRAAIACLNPSLSPSVIEDVIATVRRPESADVLAENWRIYKLLTTGVPIERRDDSGEIRHDLAWLVDFDHPERNEFLAVNQYTVEGDQSTRRPDIVLFVNGLPARGHRAEGSRRGEGDASGCLRPAPHVRSRDPGAPRLQRRVRHLDRHAGSDGAAAGRFEHYAPWKTIDGKRLAALGTPEMEVLVRGVFDPARFLDLVRNFISFSDERSGVVKRLAKYHQFHAVNKAVDTTLAAMERGDGRAGVVWHTQGSGKSLEMLFYVGKVMRHPGMANPTVVMLTDRNDLDDQLFDEVFAPARTLPETPVQAESREHLRELLRSKASGGIVFSTMQKFGLTKEDRDANRHFPVLSDRRNIVVVADEAHRTQYDLIDGLARNLRDALPHAAFMGFTGTPIETADKDTRAIFGEYVDVYDLTQAVEDQATVRVFYEARLARVELPDEVRARLDQEFDEVTELAETGHPRAAQDPMGSGRSDRWGREAHCRGCPGHRGSLGEAALRRGRQGPHRLHEPPDLREPLRRDHQAPPRVAFRRRCRGQDQGRHHRARHPTGRR